MAYVFTGKEKVVDGHNVSEVMFLREVDDQSSPIHGAQIQLAGGWIESAKNLSQNADFISPDVVVYGNAFVGAGSSVNASQNKNCRICDNATINNSTVSDCYLGGNVVIENARLSNVFANGNIRILADINNMNIYNDAEILSDRHITKIVGVGDANHTIYAYRQAGGGIGITTTFGGVCSIDDFQQFINNRLSNLTYADEYFAAMEFIKARLGNIDFKEPF